MLAILEADELRAVREVERLRIEATRQNDADVLAPLLSVHRRVAKRFRPMANARLAIIVRQHGILGWN